MPPPLARPSMYHENISGSLLICMRVTREAFRREIETGRCNNVRKCGTRNGTRREAGGGRGGGGNAFTTDHPNNSYSIVCADIHKSDVWITYTYNRPIVFFSFFFRSQTLGDNIGSGVMIRAKADLAELLKYRASSRG